MVGQTGKDRTGVVLAIILKQLGFSEEGRVWLCI